MFSGETMVFLLGRVLTSPSLASRTMASRTGDRDSPKVLEMVVSSSASPGASVRRRMFSRSCE